MFTHRVAPVGANEAAAVQLQPENHHHADEKAMFMTPRLRRGFSGRFHGWRFSVLACTTAVVTVLAVNVILVSFVGTRYGFSDGLGKLLVGDCDRISGYNTGAHVLINLLSTLLLGASNYCMQCLTAPSRREVDRAHRHGKHLQIGIASLRNLYYVSRAKRTLWVALLLSSVPLHLLYNSVVYSTLATTSYYIFAVNEAFVDTANVNTTTLYQEWDSGAGFDLDRAPSADLLASLQHRANTNGLQRLALEDCIQDYGVPYQSSRRNLILVSSPQPAGSGPKILGVAINDLTDLDIATSCAPDPVSWMCPAPTQCENPCVNRISELTANATTWTPPVAPAPVQYCLSEAIDEQCELRFSLPLALTVIAFNLCKVTFMLCMVWGYKEARLHTIGDAIQSFLKAPDSSTENACLKSQYDFECEGEVGSFDRASPAKAWRREVRSFSKAVGELRWWFSFVFYVLLILVTIALLCYGLVGTPSKSTPSAAFAIGLGAVSPVTVIYSADLPDFGLAGFVANVLVANLPQLILSFAYFTYNSLFTSMLAAYEWSKMAWHRKGLRVSYSPQGAQRSTYYLQLPYRYSIPLLVVSAVMHWLVSQSLFLVSVMRYDAEGNPITTSGYGGSGESYSGSDPALYSCGWSPIAVVLVFVGGVLMIVAGIMVGTFFNLMPGMPISGTCSAVIAAACHPHPNETATEPLELRPLQWGVVASEPHSDWRQEYTRQSGRSGWMPQQQQTNTMMTNSWPVGFNEHSNLGGSTITTMNFITPNALRSSHPYSHIPGNTLDDEVSSSGFVGNTAYGITHCAFSADEVDAPQEGMLYR